MLNLTDKELAIVKAILLEIVPGKEVRVFGSRVTDKIKSYSDLDLVIIGHNKIENKILVRLKEAFVDSMLSFRVDVLDWFCLSPEFKKIIEKGFEIIQSSKK